jgi:hypothetical protein
MIPTGKSWPSMAMQSVERTGRLSLRDGSPFPARRSTRRARRDCARLLSENRWQRSRIRWPLSPDPLTSSVKTWAAHSEMFSRKSLRFYASAKRKVLSVRWNVNADLHLAGIRLRFRYVARCPLKGGPVRKLSDPVLLHPKCSVLKSASSAIHIPNTLIGPVAFPSDGCRSYHPSRPADWAA